MPEFHDINVQDALSAFDRAASHPNPAYDFLTGFVPRKLKDLFRWGEYILYNSPHIYAALQKFGSLAVTDIEFGTSNDQLKKRYKKLFSKTLKIKNALLQASLDKHVYGNYFCSIYFPFVRYLKCNACDHMINIAMVDYQFELKTLKFAYTCKRCKKATTGKVADRKLLAADKIHIIRWDPKDVDIDFNAISGQSVYYLNIPEEVKAKVKLGSKHVINGTPIEMLAAIRDNKTFRFEKDAIFHMKVTGPAGLDPQWGLPPLASTIKLFLYTMVLRKANEAIALDHIVPFRVIHPAQASANNIMEMLNMHKWQDEFKENYKRFRRDPLHLMTSPTPVGVANVGGDGRAMLTLGELQEAEKAIMAALGIPQEFLYGGLTKAGMEATLRLIENQLQGHADDLGDLLQWFTDRISKFLGWETIEADLVPLKMVDDTETKQLVMSLATGEAPVVSLTTVLERLGVDPDEEREKRFQEAMDEARHKLRMNAELRKLQNTLAEQVRQQLEGQAGMSYDPNAVMQAAGEQVQQMMAMDPHSRDSAMAQLQQTDPVMYAVVSKQMEEAHRQMAEQGGAQSGGTDGSAAM
jgi:hypothetical protein